MKKFLSVISIAIFTISILYANPEIKSKLVNLQTSHQKDTKSIFKINNKKISEKEFKAYLSTLKEIPGTWFCAEMSNGGRTGYDAFDKNKIIYKVLLSSGTELNYRINTTHKKFLNVTKD